MKTVAIIGAGISGLTAIKTCLEDGLEPVCFEQRSELGGVWNYTDELRPGQACAAKSTITNTSKEMTCFSDYPMPDNFPNYLHNRKLLEYIRMYVDHFKLSDYIHFNVEVLSVKPTGDFDATGRWLVETTNKNNGERTSATYDAVVVANGHYSEPNHPDLPGKDIFRGKIIHSVEFRDHRGYEDKRVVIIGIGNSAADAAVDLGKFADQVYLSTNKGSWIVDRIADHGFPVDMKVLRRSIFALKSMLPKRLFHWILTIEFNKKFDHASYSLRPTYEESAEQIIVNDELPNYIINGSVIIKPGVTRLTESGVYFDDGTYVSDVDVIICATGYLVTFPFLDENIIRVRDNAVDLYRWVFPPHLAHPTLAVIGAIQVRGAVLPAVEMQCRWATKVFKGEYNLPKKEAMYKNIEHRHKELAPLCKNTLRNTMVIYLVPYMDELATEIGCKPNISRMWLYDPRLAWSCFFGPCTSYQYRLVGPHCWTGARDAILTSWQRVLQPLKTRPLNPPATSTSTIAGSSYFFCCLIILALAFLIYIRINVW